MRAINFGFILASVLLVASMAIADSTTEKPTTTTEKPTTTAVPGPTTTPYAPFNSTNESGVAAAAAFFSIGGIIIFAQIIYCFVWTKQENILRAKFQAEIDEVGLLKGGPNGSQIDMKSEHQH